MPVTCIVMEGPAFSDWLQSGHFFARSVMNASVPLYDAGNLKLSIHVDFDEAEILKAHKKYFNEGMNRAHEFLIGA